MTDDRAAFTEARDAGLAIRQQRRIETREELRRRTRREVAEEIAQALEAEARSDYDAADDLHWAAAKAREIGTKETTR